MKIIIVIPARFKSTRFPGKPLAKILGKPMIHWVADICKDVVGRENVFIATDDNKIYDFVIETGFNCIRTSEKCLTGTDRLSEVAKKINADIYVNVQGDEPLVNPEDIFKIIETKKQYPNDVINGYTEISPSEDSDDINIPKVIFTENKRLIYMSRKSLPGSLKSDVIPSKSFKQVCIYAFNRKELLDFSNFNKRSLIEQYEQIEILRFLEWGQTIRMVETSSGSCAVDTPGDIIKVEQIMKNHTNET